MRALDQIFVYTCYHFEIGIGKIFFLSAMAAYASNYSCAYINLNVIANLTKSHVTAQDVQRSTYPSYGS